MSAPYYYYTLSFPLRQEKSRLLSGIYSQEGILVQRTSAQLCCYCLKALQYQFAILILQLLII